MTLNPNSPELEQQYQDAIQRTRDLFTEILRVTQGRATNSIEFKLNEIMRAGAVRGANFKVANNRLKKQRRLVLELETLMKAHGGFKV